VAYSYQTSVFPVYNALRERTPKSYARVQTIGLGATLIVYLLVAAIGVLTFGPAVRSSVLLNYGDLRT
jgi:amino acid permease